MLSCVGPMSSIARSKQRAVISAMRFGLHHVALVLGDLGEDRQLLGLLEAAQAHGHGARLGRDQHHRRVRPVGGRGAGDEVGDARAVLPDAHAVPAGDARVAVGHVHRALLVGHGDEADAGGREDVEGVHVGRAHDAEDVGHALGDQRLDEAPPRASSSAGLARPCGRPGSCRSWVLLLAGFAQRNEWARKAEQYAMNPALASRVSGRRNYMIATPERLA